MPPSLLSALVSATCSVSFCSCSRSAAALRYCWIRILLIAAQAFIVGQAHRRNEERHRGDEADVREQREADVEERVEVGVGEEPVHERLARGDRGDLEDEAVDLHARLAARGERHLLRAGELGARLRAAVA